MEILKGDLWSYHRDGWKIVISTNIGWTEYPLSYQDPKRWPHENNMGAGIAYQAAHRWPWLPSWLGSHYRAVHRAGGIQRPVELPELGLIFVAVKPLIESDPAYSWNQKACPTLIRGQLDMLAAHSGNIALGFVGCGNGALEQAQVLPALLKLELRRAHLGHGKTVVVDWQAQ